MTAMTIDAMTLTLPPVAAFEAPLPARAGSGRGVAGSATRGSVPARHATPQSRRAQARRVAVLRRRAVMTFVLVSLGMSVGLWATRAEATPPAASPPTIEIVVREGDTLWRYAERLAEPGQDVRVVVAQLEELNGMTGAGLVAGQTLLLPAPK